MVEQISEFVLCEFPKSVAAEKIKNFNFAIQNVKKGPIQEREMSKVFTPSQTDKPIFIFSNLISKFISSYNEVSPIMTLAAKDTWLT